MGSPHSSFKNYVAAAANAITGAKTLRRITVNTGVAASTVTVTDSATGAIAIIDSALSGTSWEYGCGVNGLIVTLSDAALDVTVIYD
jgi:hypothetical protein